LRVQSKSAWVIYAITLVIGFYSHLFFTFVAAAHGIYTILFITSQNRGHYFSRKLFLPYMLASLTALLAYSPWIGVVIVHYHTILDYNQWSGFPLDFIQLVRGWAASYSRVFVDFEPFQDLVKIVFGFPILFLIGTSLFFIWRKGQENAWKFIFLLIGTTAGSLILPDLILGGYRSIIARYIMPCFIGILLAVACFLSTQIAASRYWRQKVWQLIVLTLFLLSIMSNFLLVRSESWWDKGGGGDHGRPKMMQTINEADRPLLIVDGHIATHLGHFLSFGHELDPHVNVKWGFNVNDETYDHYSDIFIYHPSNTLWQALVRGSKYQLEEIVPQLLYHLAKIEKS